MIIKYQLAFIGNKHYFIPDILASFYRQLDELGVNREYILLLDEGNFATEYKGNAPLYCVYFGDPNGDFKNLDILEKLISQASLILPVVDGLENFTVSTPAVLRYINGFELNSRRQIESLTGLILESFGLLRSGRKLFISYRREESAHVAIQLFEQLEKHGFEVYLDTHSLRKGEPFPEELWHRLADTDVMVLLNTPNFLKGEWAQKELAKANALKIGILQILWPGQKIDVNATLSIPMQLVDHDFGNKIYAEPGKHLSEGAISRIVEQVEYLRARTLAARQDNIISEFLGAANRVGRKADLYPRRLIRTTKLSGEEAIVIPAVGVPEAFTYQHSEDLVAELGLKKKPSLFLLFDHINIRDKWLKHLNWLDVHLPVKGIKITGAEEWFREK
jgi:hypothetical protein